MIEEGAIDATLQNFIDGHIVDQENVQKDKKKEKGKFTRCQVSSNQMSKPIHVKN